MRESKEKADFQSFRQQVDNKMEKDVEWKNRMAVKVREEAFRKQETALGQKRKRLLAL